jgi:hypothetical protein
MNMELIEKLKREHHYDEMTEEEKKKFNLYVLFWSSESESD